MQICKQRCCKLVSDCIRTLFWTLHGTSCLEKQNVFGTDFANKCDGWRWKIVSHTTTTLKPKAINDWWCSINETLTLPLKTYATPVALLCLLNSTCRLGKVILMLTWITPLFKYHSLLSMQCACYQFNQLLLPCKKALTGLYYHRCTVMKKTDILVYYLKEKNIFI